ncbi:MAG: hypothetical protein LUH12_01770 [Bacteroides sp.]|nr:hypothetical protein [Bacteroides sp.]
MSSFVGAVNYNMNGDGYFNPNENVFDSIWEQYKSIILQSLVTSFGLDFLVHDRYGGDVDTIHNVRQIDIDPEMTYKNSQNAMEYENRGEYDSTIYHSDPKYIAVNKNVSAKKKEGTLKDSYTGKTVAMNANIDLDHVVSANEIHNDRGRVLSGVSGLDLANCEKNLKPTDRTINRSMKADDMEDYLSKHEANAPERRKRIAFLEGKVALSDKERKELVKLKKLEEIDPKRMRSENTRARKAYNAKINNAYYTSEKFYRDTTAAAANRGMEMGMRQALGFVFVEIWMGAESELKEMPSGSDLKDMLYAVPRGIKRGFERAKVKYKEILSKLGDGFVAGSLASITTTICNIFFTTAKNLVRCIRQVYASVVQAGKVLLFNPDNLDLGDRIKTSAVIIATGASVLVGTAVGEIVSKTPLGLMPGIGPIVQTFTATLVSGLLSCTLAVFLDRSQLINSVVAKLNSIPSEANNYREIADAFERLAAKMAALDLAKFRADTERYRIISSRINIAGNEEELNQVLQDAYKTFGIRIPWEGDFNDFMGNRNNRLVFE